MVSAVRVDVALVAAGLFESRSKACAAIAAGLVRADGKPVAKASAMVAREAVLEAEAAFPWVSRGGVKLDAGLDAFGFDPQGRHALDIGASTGGFTDVLLRRGAAHVTAVDVGRDQCHPSLRGDARVTLHERCDARTLDPAILKAPIDLVVCDVSFISLKLVLPSVLRLAAPRARLVALVKPQFEAGRRLARKGVVRDPAVHIAVCDDLLHFVAEQGCHVLGVVPSPIEGGDGNREFLLGAQRADV